MRRYAHRRRASSGYGAVDARVRAVRITATKVERRRLPRPPCRHGRARRLRPHRLHRLRRVDELAPRLLSLARRRHRRAETRAADKSHALLLDGRSSVLLHRRRQNRCRRHDHRRANRQRDGGQT